MSKYLTYSEAKQVVHTLGLRSHAEWNEYIQCRYPKPMYVNRAGNSISYRPLNIPYEPRKHYTKTNEWISFPDFLGYKPKSETKYWDYQTAKDYAQKHNIKSEIQWYAHHKRYKLKRVPKKVAIHFRKTGDWISWAHFLNHNIVHSTEKANIYLPAIQARKYIHALNLSNKTQYRKWWEDNRPYFLPRSIDVIYGRTGQFSSFDDFLGIGIYSRMQLITVDISVLYIAKIPNTPSNVYEIAIEPKGEIEVITKAKKQQFYLTKIYEYDVNESKQLHQIMRQNCTNWWEGESTHYVVQNIHQLIYELNMIFNRIAPNSLI